MKKKELVNKKIISAITIGLATFMAVSQPVTVLAGEVENEAVDVHPHTEDSSEIATASEQAEKDSATAADKVQIAADNLYDASTIDNASAAISAATDAITDSQAAVDAANSTAADVSLVANETINLVDAINSELAGDAAEENTGYAEEVADVNNSAQAYEEKYAEQIEEGNEAVDTIIDDKLSNEKAYQAATDIEADKIRAEEAAQKASDLLVEVFEAGKSAASNKEAYSAAAAAAKDNASEIADAVKEAKAASEDATKKFNDNKNEFIKCLNKYKNEYNELAAKYGLKSYDGIMASLSSESSDLAKEGAEILAALDRLESISSVDYKTLEAAAVDLKEAGEARDDAWNAYSSATKVAEQAAIIIEANGGDASELNDLSETKNALYDAKVELKEAESELETTKAVVKELCDDISSAKKDFSISEKLDILKDALKKLSEAEANKNAASKAYNAALKTEQWNSVVGSLNDNASNDYISGYDKSIASGYVKLFAQQVDKDTLAYSNVENFDTDILNSMSRPTSKFTKNIVQQKNADGSIKEDYDIMNTKGFNDGAEKTQSIELPFQMYCDYIYAMSKEYNFSNASRVAGKGATVLDSSNKLSKIFWVVDEKHRATGEFKYEDELTEEDYGKDFFVGYILKLEENNFHIDGYFVNFSAPQKHADIPTPDEEPTPIKPKPVPPTPGPTPQPTPDEPIYIPDEPVPYSPTPVIPDTPVFETVISTPTAGVLGERRELSQGVLGARRTTEGGVLGERQGVLGARRGVLGERKGPKTDDSSAMGAAILGIAGSACLAGVALTGKRKKEEE